MMIGTISSAGIGSGLDIQSLVSQLVAAERAPTANRLARQETEARVALTAYGQLRSGLAALQSKLQDLGAAETTGARTATVSDEDVLSVSAAAGAALGTFDVEVLALAQSGRLGTATPRVQGSAVGAGTLDIDLGTDSFSLNLSDPATTLADIRDAINSAIDNPGVQAALIQVDGGEVLSLSSERMGAQSEITVTGGGDLTTLAADLNVLVVAQDAQLRIDGHLVTHADNNVDGAIGGVQLQLLEARPGEQQSVTIARDEVSQVDSFSALVESWNAFAELADNLSLFDASGGTAGPLNGDSLLRGIENRLQRAFGDAYGTGDGFQAAEFGFAFNSQGLLELDTERLNEVISNAPDDLAAWWEGETGLSGVLESMLDDLLASEAGLSTRETGLQSRLDRLELANDRLDLRMERVQERYLKQFTALDVALAELQRTSSFLSQQLSSLPGADSN